jgi:hypothetical protein
MSKSIIVQTVGRTDTYTNSDVSVTPNGALVITINGRTKKRVTYANGRWSKTIEEGITA